MLLSQNGVCSICKDPSRVKKSRTGILHVDHDHKTGKVRGLICNACNSILGYGDADNGPELLLKAVQYIKDHS
jgi:Recombination endonuclease VII